MSAWADDTTQWKLELSRGPVNSPQDGVISQAQCSSRKNMVALWLCTCSASPSPTTSHDNNNNNNNNN
jgi:hypothetical protein